MRAALAASKHPICLSEGPKPARGSLPPIMIQFYIPASLFPLHARPSGLERLPLLLLHAPPGLDMSEESHFIPLVFAPFPIRLEDDAIDDMHHAIAARQVSLQHPGSPHTHLCHHWFHIPHRQRRTTQGCQSRQPDDAGPALAVFSLGSLSARCFLSVFLRDAALCGASVKSRSIHVLYFLPHPSLLGDGEGLAVEGLQGLAARQIRRRHLHHQSHTPRRRQGGRREKRRYRHALRVNEKACLHLYILCSNYIAFSPLSPFRRRRG